jgi:N6-adenosine-specific RNA methylase IME4/ParB-like chromosome segregation protein Spo0J
LKTLPIKEIKIGKRVRKDLGDLTSLMQSIEKVGLLHPVVVDQDCKLIAGHRRLDAYKKLKRDEIPVTVVKNLSELQDRLTAERDENTERKQMTGSEMVETKRIMEPYLRAQAKERQREHGKTAPGKHSAQKTQSDRPKRTDDAVAMVCGVSASTLKKATAVVEASEKDPSFLPIVEEMDRTGNIDKAMQQTKKAIRLKERSEKHEEIKKGNVSLPTEKRRYAVIYCDPPWQYECNLDNDRAVDNHYPTMPTPDICALPVAAMALEDAALFMWATAPKIMEAGRIIEAWGFTYKTCAIWDKELIGIGNYFRTQHELLLVATKGNMMAPEVAGRPTWSIYKEPRGKHSVKPQAFYGIIEAMYPTAPRIELFARNKRDGWDAWGNEAAND